MLNQENSPMSYIVGHTDKAVSVARRARLYDLSLSSGRELPILSFPESQLGCTTQEQGVFDSSAAKSKSMDIFSQSKQNPYIPSSLQRRQVRLPSYSDLERNVAGKMEQYENTSMSSPTVFRGTWRESFHSRERGEYLQQRGYPSLMAKTSVDRYDNNRYPVRYRTPSRTLSPWSSFPQRSRYNVYMRAPARHSSYPTIDKHEFSNVIPLMDSSLDGAAPSRYQSSPEWKHASPTRASPTTVPALSDNQSSASVSPSVPTPSDGHMNATQGPSRRTEANQCPKRRGKLPKAVIYHLKTWLLEHEDHPYPTEEEKRGFCETTGLDISQVSNWFVNARRRIFAPQQNAAKATA